MAKRLDRQRLEYLDDPVVVSFDPGVTTGWSVMKVHPDALALPDISILGNIQHWAHGQISAESADFLAVGSADPTRHNKLDRIAKTAGNGWVTGTDPENRAVYEMVEVVRQWPGCAVVAEDFIVRQFNQSRDFLSPVRILAAFEYAMFRMGKTVYRQQASEAKGAVTDERLKRWGFYDSKGAQRHARDADRHNITFLRKCKDMNKGHARRALTWPHIYGRGGSYADPRRQAS